MASRPADGVAYGGAVRPVGDRRRRRRAPPQPGGASARRPPRAAARTTGETRRAAAAGRSSRRGACRGRASRGLVLLEAGELVQALDRQPRLGQRGDDLAERVVPLVLHRRRDVGVGVGVAAAAVDLVGVGLGAVEVGVARRRAAPRSRRPGRTGTGGTRRCRRCRRGRGSRRSGAPSASRSGSQQSTPHEVKTMSKRPSSTRRQLVEVGLDEGRRQAALGRQAARQGDRPAREVDAGDGRPQARPRQRVEAEVALQVQQALAGHLGPELVELGPGRGSSGRPGTPRRRRRRSARGWR